MGTQHSMEDINGTNLSLKYHKAIDAKALVIIVHGYGEYIDRYQHVIDYLLGQNFDVLGYDQRNHGRSDGKQAYIENFDVFADDLHTIYSKYGAEKKCYLLCHSMGGLVVSDYLIRYPDDNIKGVVFTGPAIQVPADVSPVLQKMAGVIAAITPKLKTVKLDISKLTRDEEILKRYQNDPYVYTGATYAKTGSVLLAKQKSIKEDFYKIKKPIVIYQGTEDILADPEGTKAFYEAVGSQDKELRMLDGWYHEILNEPERLQVLDSINTWITERL